MLNSCDERPALGHVDLELLEPDERDLAGDLVDAQNEVFRTDSGPTMCAVDEPWSQQISDRLQVSPGDCRCDLSEASATRSRSFIMMFVFPALPVRRWIRRLFAVFRKIDCAPNQRAGHHHQTQPMLTWQGLDGGHSFVIQSL